MAERDSVRAVEALKIQQQTNSVARLKMAEKEEKLLVDMEQYLKAGIHIGTKFKTSYMNKFIYKARPDGLFVLNLQKIDERLVQASTLLANYEPEDIIVVARRENSWKAAKAFGKATGIRVFAGRYPPGILTNPNLRTFMEAKIMIVTDAWPDRNAVKDALKVGIPIIGLCDTNNQANNIDFVVPCNNKGKKSLGLLFWILAREFMKKKGMGDLKESLDDFTEQ